jgi:hypothetical protein
MKQRPKQAQPGRAAKKPYQTPVLTVHGNLGSLTAAKKGKRVDGTGKPKTRTTGSL